MKNTRERKKLMASIRLGNTTVVYQCLNLRSNAIMTEMKKLWDKFSDVFGKTIIHPQFLLKKYENKAC